MRSVQGLENVNDGGCGRQQPADLIDAAGVGCADDGLHVSGHRVIDVGHCEGQFVTNHCKRHPHFDAVAVGSLRPDTLDIVVFNGLSLFQAFRQFICIEPSRFFRGHDVAMQLAVLVFQADLQMVGTVEPIRVFLLINDMMIGDQEHGPEVVAPLTDKVLEMHGVGIVGLA